VWPKGGEGVVRGDHAHARGPSAARAARWPRVVWCGRGAWCGALRRGTAWVMGGGARAPGGERPWCVAMMLEYGVEACWRNRWGVRGLAYVRD